MSFDYLTLDEVLAIHADQIETYGGSHGVRDWGQLESALARPRTGYYPDLIAEAAALWESLAQNHPFVDGNKRTSFACTTTFLRINGASFAPGKQDVIDFILCLYTTPGSSASRSSSPGCGRIVPDARRPALPHRPCTDATRPAR